LYLKRITELPLFKRWFSKDSIEAVFNLDDLLASRAEVGVARGFELAKDPGLFTIRAQTKKPLNSEGS